MALKDAAMKKISYRQLQPAQEKPFRELLTLFGTVFEMEEDYCQNQPDSAYIQTLLENPHFIALAALSENKIVGGLCAYILPKFEQARSEAYIYDLAVSDHFRRRGIATDLILKLKKIVKEKGVYVIFVQADWGDEPPINLYSKLGRKEQVLQFDIEVED